MLCVLRQRLAFLGRIYQTERAGRNINIGKKKKFTNFPLENLKCRSHLEVIGADGKMGMKLNLNSVESYDGVYFIQETPEIL